MLAWRSVSKSSIRLLAAIIFYPDGSWESQCWNCAHQPRPCLAASSGGDRVHTRKRPSSRGTDLADRRSMVSAGPGTHMPHGGATIAPAACRSSHHLITAADQ